MQSARKQAINLYGENLWEKFLSNFKFWEEPYETVERMLPKTGTISELGCGEGLLTNYLAISSPKRKIIGIEIVPERLELAKKGIKNTKYKVGDITDVPFPKADAAILFHVLHHLPSGDAQEKVLEKTKKSLKKGGKMIIVDVHVKPTLKFVAAWFADHFLVPWVFEKRFYTRAYFRKEEEWLALLKKLGFKVKVTEETANRPFPNIIFECKLN
jgi:SAM-dependent methyltransferase